jgi:hypothetical protein
VVELGLRLGPRWGLAILEVGAWRIAGGPDIASAGEELCSTKVQQSWWPVNHVVPLESWIAACVVTREGLDPHGLGMDEPDTIWVATTHHGRGGREAHVK